MRYRRMAMATLEKENDRLREALEFYANADNWRNDTVDIGVSEQEIPQTSECHSDRGRIARAALELEAAA